MPQSCYLLSLVPALASRKTRRQLATPQSAFFAFAIVASALFALCPLIASAQTRTASDTPLHLPVNRFEFVALSDSPPAAKPLAVHNGGTVRLNDVRLTRLAYADSARGSGWLVSQPRQSAVAPDELATIGMLCVDAAGLLPGTYRATAAVGAREISEPVAITITLVVTDAGARARNAAASCGNAIAK